MHSQAFTQLASLSFEFSIFFFNLSLPLKSPEAQHAAILALGFMVGRYMSRKRRPQSPNTPNQQQQLMSTTPAEDDELISKATKTIGRFRVLGIRLGGG